MFRIEILKDGDVVHVHALGAQPTHIGRAGTNELVLADPRVSGRHALVWTEGDEVWVEDLGSRNGTTIDGRPLTRRQSLGEGAKIVLGDSVELRIAGSAAPTMEGLPALLLEDTRSGVRIPVRGDRLTIGGDPSSGLVLPDVALRVGTLLFHPDEIWLGTDEDTVEITVGAPFEVAGVRLVLRADSGEATRTEGLDQARYAYRLDVQLDGPAGPGARLQDLRTGADHRVTSEIRATLLYVLGRQLAEDLAAGLPADERGWMHDDDVASGIWGRERFKIEPNNFHVLVHRTRKEVAASGFDPWFLEKKRRHLRLRLDEVNVS